MAPHSRLEADTPSSATEQPVEGEKGARRPWRRRPLLAAATALLVILSLVVGWVVLRGLGGTPTDPTSAELSWAPPELTDPTTIEVSDDNRSFGLRSDRDYIIEMPDEPLSGARGLIIRGGRNVVLIGGHIHIDSGRDRDGRALYLKDQTGTVHVEGLLIDGPSLTEGINLDQRLGATVQLQNIRVEQVSGSFEGFHADVVQTWAGPDILRIDRLSGISNYQGFFLKPRQFGEQPAPTEFDLRNIDILGVPGAAYLIWREEGDWPMHLDNVWLAQPQSGKPADRIVWADGGLLDEVGDGIQIGVPAHGPFVTADEVGVDYSSPGYLNATDG